MCKDKERNKKRDEGKIVINNNNNKVTSTIAKDGENDENYL